MQGHFFNRWTGKWERRVKRTKAQKRKRKLEWQRKHRKETNNISNRRYEKTLSGFLMRAYRNILMRVTGKNKKKAHLYKGLPCVTKEEFYAWARSDRDLARLWRDWVASGYMRKLSPSVNRIDTSKGYILGNMEWLTHSENSRMGSYGRKQKEMLAIRRLL